MKKLLNKLVNITITEYKNEHDYLSNIYSLDEYIKNELETISYISEIKKISKNIDKLFEFNNSISTQVIKPFADNKYLKIMPLAFCNKYHYEVSWSIFNKNVIKQLCDYILNQTVLSIGSGQAFNEYLLQLSGVNIIATDNYQSYGKNKVYYTKVLQLDATESIKQFKTDILYLSWPIKDVSMAYNSLKLFKGSKLIYIGDMRLTANNEFYKLLNKKWKLVKNIKLPQWNNIQDVIHIYEKI